MNEYKPIDVTTAINMLPMLFLKPYVVSKDSETVQKLSPYNVTIDASDEEYDRLSQFGTPVLGSFWIIPDDLPYKVWNNDDKLVEREFSEFEWPVATIVDFSRPKNVVKSATIGGKGTVKEIMGLSDWDIAIHTLIVDDDSRIYQTTAKQQQYIIDRINEIATSLKVRGKIFEERYITHIVFESVSFSAVQGKPGLIQCEIKASSDESFIISGL